MTGKVKFYNTDRGFGFIIPEDGMGEIFFHAKGLAEQVEKHDTVTYEIQKTSKGLQAINVKLV